MSVLRRMGKHVAEALVGGSRYIESVFVAVLLAPILPDILLDFFGRRRPVGEIPRCGEPPCWE